MRAAHTIVALLVLLCVSCSDNIRTFHLSGSGTGAGDTLYLYGMDNRYPQMDTIVAGEDGKFSHTVPAIFLSLLKGMSKLYHSPSRL